MPRKPANPQPAVFQGTGKRLSPETSTSFWGFFSGMSTFLLLDSLKPDHLTLPWQAPFVLMVVGLLACLVIINVK